MYSERRRDLRVQTVSRKGSLLLCVGVLGSQSPRTSPSGRSLSRIMDLEARYTNRNKLARTLSVGAQNMIITVRPTRHDMTICVRCTYRCIPRPKGHCPAEAHPRKHLLDCSKPRAARILAPSAASPSTTAIPVAPTLHRIHTAVHPRKKHQEKARPQLLIDTQGMSGRFTW